LALPEQPTQLRVRLGAELQAARTIADISQRTMARALGIHQTTVSRVERGELLLSAEQLTTWLNTAKTSRDLRSRLRALTKAAHSETRTWQELQAQHAHMQAVSRERNAAARRVQIFDPTVLPGLLQTADYARRIIDLADITASFDHAAALSARVERQGILREPGRTFQFVIAERLLRWEPEPGAPVLGPQLAQLAAAAKLDAVDIAVLPESFVGALPWHNFVIREPADGTPAYVMVELIHGEQEVVEGGDVAVYQTMWDRLWKASATGDDAVALIHQVAIARD
jgi:transcriptional regulator with XRE-family HTH domain